MVHFRDATSVWLLYASLRLRDSSTSRRPSAGFGGSAYKAIFFELKKSGLVSYIFGTNHVGIGLTEVPDSILARMKTQKLYVTETLKEDSQESTDDATAIKPFSAGVIQQMENRGMNPQWIQIARKFPNLFCTLYESYEGIRDHLILDEQLEELATQENLRKVALDDPSTIKKINHKKHESCDPEKVTHETPGAQAKKDYEDRLTTYRAGDLKDAQVENDDPNEVAERNRAWVKEILKLHRKQAFIVVGYGHLGGPMGLLRALEGKGFAIKRIEK